MLMKDPSISTSQGNTNKNIPRNDSTLYLKQTSNDVIYSKYANDMKAKPYRFIQMKHTAPWAHTEPVVCFSKDRNSVMSVNMAVVVEGRTSGLCLQTYGMTRGL